MTAPAQDTTTAESLVIKLKTSREATGKTHTQKTPETPSTLLSTKDCLDILEAMGKNPAQRSLLINHLVLLAMNVLTNSGVTGQAKYTQAHTQLKNTLPPFKRGVAFFPSGWSQKTTKSANSLYAAWSLNTQKPITLNLSKQATVTAKISSNHSIELYIHGFKPDQNSNNELIADFAHAIYACVCAYSSAIVTIHSENIQDYEALIDYLYAYQKIQTTLAPKQSQSEPQVPALQIKLEGAKYDHNEGKVDQAVKDILKDEEIHNLYQKAQLLTPPNRIMDLR